jgi:diguanylate cyclase (GGDEF)-like protein/PAS domain S-box-containing protein
MAKRAAGDEARLVAAVREAFEDAGSDHEPVLELVCRLGADLTGDPWILRLVDDDDMLVLAGVAAADPETEADLRATFARDRAPWNTSLAAAILGEDGAPVLIPPADVDGKRTGRHGHVRTTMERLGITGGILAPLRTRSRTFGVIWWACQHDPFEHDEVDLLFASSVADRCALAIENARLLSSLREELEDRRHAEARQAALLAHVSDAVVVVDVNGVVTDITAGVPRVLGWDRDTVVGQNVFDYVHPDDHAHAIERFLNVIGDDDLPATTVRIRHANGSWLHMEVSGDDLVDDPSVQGVVITAHDVTERWWADALLGDENEILELVARGADLHSTLDGICRLMDQRVGGVATIWLIDEARDELVSVAGPGIVSTSAATVGTTSLGETGAWWVRLLPDEVLVSDPSTDPYWAEWKDEAERFRIRGSWTYCIRDAEGRHLGALIVYRSRFQQPDTREKQVTELAARLAGVAVSRDRDARDLAHAATHDSVTGAANRALFVDRLHAAVANPRRGAQPPAVLFIDLDRFKQLNDRAGHAVGDAALRVLADRLQALVRDGDVVARFGGDEFSVLCAETPEDVALQVAGRLLAAIQTPVEVAGRTHRLAASIGVAVGAPGIDAEGLVRRADLAMYRAKSLGRGRVVAFDDSLLGPSDRDEIERALRIAIDGEQLTVHFQPVVDLRSREWVAVEALARWDHPTLGSVPPELFVTIAEECGLGGALTERVLDLVCAQAVAWRDDEVLGEILLGANITGRQVSDPAFATALAQRLAKSGIEPSRIFVELTESSLMDDYDTARTGLEALRALGVRAAIDDFGTGHSTLARLRQLPVDGVKLDRTFIGDLGDDQRDEDVVAAVVQLAHAVGMPVCAEGVESSEQLEILQRLGVDTAQGFLLARPVPADEVRPLLSKLPAALRPGFLRVAGT